jgi:hypothetical protein
MTVAAGDSHAGLGETERRTDNVHDALFGTLGRPQIDAELAAIPLESRRHLFRHQIDEGAAARIGRNDVIDSGKCAIGISNS